MDPGWIEQTTTREWERSIDGFYHCVRRFRVFGYDRHLIASSPQACTNAAGVPLPVVGERANGAASGDSFTLENGREVWCYALSTKGLEDPRYTDVEFRYSNDLRIISIIPDQVSSFQTEYITIPIAVKARKTNAGVNVRDAWVTRGQSFPYTVGRYTRDCLIPISQLFTAAQVARSQVNNLHHVQTAFTGGDVAGVGRLFRFEGPEFRNYSPNYHLVRYSWWYDSGNRELILNAASSAELATEVHRPPQNIPFDNDEWVRPPYHSLEAVKLDGGSSSDVPRYVAFSPNPIEEDGWLSLVGIT